MITTYKIIFTTGFTMTYPFSQKGLAKLIREKRVRGYQKVQEA